MQQADYETIHNTIKNMWRQPTSLLNSGNIEYRLWSDTTPGVLLSDGEFYDITAARFNKEHDVVYAIVDLYDTREFIRYNSRDNHASLICPDNGEMDDDDYLNLLHQLKF